MTVTKRIRRIVIGVAAASVAVVAVAVTVPAEAADDNSHGQVILILDTVPRDLNSVQAFGEPCREMDWENFDEFKFEHLEMRGKDGTLRTTKGAQLVFQGFSSKDCTGDPLSNIARTFGDPDNVWATGSSYHMPWKSN